MPHRFVFTDRDGREVHLDDEVELRDAIERGAVTDDTPLLDEATDAWGPARTHVLYRRLRADIAGSADVGGSDVPPDEGPAAGSTPVSDDDLDMGGLTLAEPVADPEADDTVEAFKERLERERQQARELDPGAAHEGLDMVRGSSVADIADATDATEPGDASTGSADDRTGEPDPATDRSRPDPRSRPPAVVDRAAPLFRSAGSELPDARPAPEVGPRGFDRPGLRHVAMLAILAGVGAWGIAEARAGDASADLNSEILILESSQGSGPPPEGLMEVRASEAAAFEDMREGMDRIRMRMEVGRPPLTWLSGSYLADPASAPEVREFWMRYATFVDSIRAVEEDLFQSGFSARLQEVGITGPVLSIRIARGLTQFREDRPRRDLVYDAMEGLATEALSFDTWLRSVSGRIAYAGVREDALSMAPDLEAAALDEDTAAELDRRLDAVLDALDVVTGFDPAEAGNLTGRALGELGGEGTGR